MKQNVNENFPVPAIMHPFSQNNNYLTIYRGFAFQCFTGTGIMRYMLESNNNYSRIYNTSVKYI